MSNFICFFTVRSSMVGLLEPLVPWLEETLKTLEKI